MVDRFRQPLLGCCVLFLTWDCKVGIPIIGGHCLPGVVPYVLT